MESSDRAKLTEPTGGRWPGGTRAVPEGLAEIRRAGRHRQVGAVV